MEEVDERAFLLGGEGGADAYHHVGRVVGADEDLLDIHCRLKGSGNPLHIGRSFSDVLPDGCKHLGSEGCRSELAALDLALIGPLERSADGDDPTWAQHLELVGARLEYFYDDVRPFLADEPPLLLVEAA